MPALLTVGAVYLLAVGLIVLWPTRVTGAFSGILEALDAWIPGAARQLEFGANVLLFVPAGVLSGALLPKALRWVAVVLGALTSVGIEFAQGVFLPGRVDSLRDVLANTAGMIVGVIIGPSLLVRRESR